MKGYFAGTSNLKTILKEYYDRIKESCNSDDVISLNYINTKMERDGSDIQSFLINAQGNCTAQYTKLGDILAMSMDYLEDNSVNLLVSDFCFTTNVGLAIGAARSEITKLFAERIIKNKDISIAILKYDCDFNGKYYPGGIPCNQSLPIYIWVFGLSDQVKYISRLPIKENCGNVMMFQPWQELQPNYIVKNARMWDKKDNSIIVSKWDKSRHGNIYELSFDVNMSSVLLDEQILTDIAQYTISKGYDIDSIGAMGNDVYRFNISTTHPSPGEIEVNLTCSMPDWVEESNFSGSGIPPAGQTLNVKYLIEGVYDAYHNKSDKYLTIKLKLK